MLNISESGHSVFRGSGAVERRDLKSKGKGILCTHFCGDDRSAELFLRTIISVNQLSIYGAAAVGCDELACRISGCSECTWKLVAQDTPETAVIPVELTTTMTTCKETSRTSSIDQTMLQCRCHKDGGDGTVFHDPRRCRTGQIGRLSRENFDLETAPVSKVKGWIRGNTKIDPAFGGGSQSSPRPLRHRDHDREWNFVMDLFHEESS